MTFCYSANKAAYGEGGRVRLLHGRWTAYGVGLYGRLLARPPSLCKGLGGRPSRRLLAACKEWKGAGGRRPPANFDEIRRDESFLSIGTVMQYEKEAE